MSTAIVGVVGIVVGAVLAYFGQYLQAKQQHKWAIEAAKSRAYTEFLRSISASYAQAKSEAESQQSGPPEAKSQQSGPPEDANLLAATAAIELLTKETLSEEVRKLSDEVIRVHGLLRHDLNVDTTEVPGVDAWRKRVIKLFQDDLRISTRGPTAPDDPHRMGSPDRI